MGKSHKISKESRHLNNKDKQKDKRAYSKKTSKRNYKSSEETKFSEELYDMGYTIIIMDGDGNCLFRSFADQLCNDDSKHFEYRSKIMAHIKKHKDHFSLFLEDDEPFDDYIDRMKDPGEWGGHPELYAASQCLNVNIFVHQVDGPRFKLPAADSTVSKEIHISYHGECHYNSVRSTHAPKPVVTVSTTESKSNTKDKSKVSRNSKPLKSSSDKGSHKSQSPHQIVSTALPWASVDDITSALTSMDGCADSAIDFLATTRDIESLGIEVEKVVSNSVPQTENSTITQSDRVEMASLNSTSSSQPLQPPPAEVVSKTKKEVRDEKRRESKSSADTSTTAVLNRAGRSMSKKELRQLERQRQQQSKTGVLSNATAPSGDAHNNNSNHQPDSDVGEGSSTRVEIVL